MAEDMHNPHDKLVRAVLGTVASATSFLQTPLPRGLIKRLDWQTPQAT